jgi:hypothetical protein
MCVELYSKYMQNIISLKDIKIYTPQESNWNNTIPGLSKIKYNKFFLTWGVLLFFFSNTPVPCSNTS